MDASRGGAFHTDADFEAGRVHTVHHALRRGKIITDEELAVDEADEGGAGTSGGIGSGTARSRTTRARMRRWRRRGARSSGASPWASKWR